MNGEQTRRRGRERPSLFPFPRDARKKQERRGSQIFVQTLPRDDDAMKRRVRPECKLHWDLSVAVAAAKARATFALSRGRGCEPHWMMIHGRAGAEISQASTRIGVNIQFGEMEPRRREEVEPECQYLDCTLQEFKPGNNKRRTLRRSSSHQVHQICCIGKKKHAETAGPHPGIS